MNLLLCWLVAVGILTLWCPCAAAVLATEQTGFWYGRTDLPVTNYTNYDSIPYVNMTIKINRPFQDGPGQNLTTDPIDHTLPLYVGNTINRQTFEAQFVLEIEKSLEVSRDRIFVMNVKPGDVHFSWETTNVIVNFIITECNSTCNVTLLQAVQELTAQSQDLSSPLYTGGTFVTNFVDPDYGLNVVNWDMSIKLTYPIEVVGDVISISDDAYITHGGLRTCDQEDAWIHAYYCEFERLFEDDIAMAMDIVPYRVQVFFVKRAALDAVLMHFRILPPHPAMQERSVLECLEELHRQVIDFNSILYDGNVTIRVDPTWGISGEQGVVRDGAARFTLKYYDYEEARLNNSKIASIFTPYDRCKANRRCNWGEQRLDQSTNDIAYSHRLFDRGERTPVKLFLDFEDWRLGTRGWNWDGEYPATSNANRTEGAKDGYYSEDDPEAPEVSVMSWIKGAHFWPFNQTSLGPVLPAYHHEENHGLVLDRQNLHKQIHFQEALIDDIKGRVDWTRDNDEWSTMGAELRSRKDVKRNMSYVAQDFEDWEMNERVELGELSSSQCSMKNCTIMFNTSSLELMGAINDTGVLRHTDDGTEVAVYTFDSIYLGPETEVILVGQRALSLVSKTQAIINTTFRAYPGTIGGFQGGFNTARLWSESLSDTPRDIRICDIGDYCSFADRNETDRNFTQADRDTIVTNNVNGPGSGNLRVLPFVVTTSAQDINEVQIIVTTAQQGQTLGGGFKLHFGAFTTPLIAHDCSASLMERIIEENLNVMSPRAAGVAARPRNSNRYVDGKAGVGQVSVTRTPPDDEEGFQWTIVYESVIGNVEQIRFTNYLTGLAANIYTDTIQHGNELLGSFALTLPHLGETTGPISARESAGGMHKILMALPSVQTAWVTRNDPTENCDDGLCPNGPLQSRGFIWSIYVTTIVDNKTPVFPNSWKADTDFPWLLPTADFSLLEGVNASVSVVFNGETSTDDKMQKLTVDRPFSLAYGGAGASYGGLGGRGYADNPTGPLYGDRTVPDLLGGSGGCMRGPHPMEINIGPISTAYGRGGHGGGAIEIVAANDIHIGTYGKFIMNGGDGEQTSEGGGGGGSGGSIVLAAGGIVQNDGLLDVHGGAGGYGGVGKGSIYSEAQKAKFSENSWEYKTMDDMAGGGGGGGRIAIYGQSIVATDTSDVTAAGGPCGVYKSMTNQSIVVLNATLRIDAMGMPLDTQRLLHLGAVFLNDSLPTERVFNDGFKYITPVTDGVMEGGVMEGYFKVYARTAALESADEIIDTFRGRSLMTLGGTHIRVRSLVTASESTGSLDLINEEHTVCTNPGDDGSVYTETKMTTTMYVRPTYDSGAEGTAKALFMSNREKTKTITGSPREAPFSWNGPTIRFERSQPTRVTYYTKLVSVAGESTKSNFGTLFSLLQGTKVTSIIGVFVGDQIKFGNNYGSAVDERYYLKRFSIIDEYPSFDRWYKVDIHIRWDTKKYYILLDDTIVTPEVDFTGDYINGIRLSLTRAVDVWFDEIYVGFDNTMDFKCPVVNRANVDTLSPIQRGWTPSEVNEAGNDGNTQYFNMRRHYNFMSDAGTVPFDGQGHVSVFADIKNKFADGDYPTEKGKLFAGALVYLTNSERSGKQPSGKSATIVNPKGLWYKAPDGLGGAGDGRHYWYTDHLWEYIDHVDPAYPEYASADKPVLSGGIAACSSGDFLTWRFEGIVYHFANTSDMVLGREGPFTMERPKILYNPPTKQYVMYAAFDRSDSENRDLAMSAIATSPFEDGPFLFRRSFYPDGNLTRDQVTYINGGQPVLGRTYYASVEFVLPEQMMQPVWESVKNKRGEINFTTNYHRAIYDSGYDNFHDIYEQRWRGEDQPYQVQCIDKLNTSNVRLVAPGEMCIDPEERKVVLGQGDPPITTKFVSPDNSDNSWWMATSVPSVRAQPWSSNYRDGYCGIRRLDSNLEMDDPDLDYYSFEPRDVCSNIADNPTHPTMPDKLIGVQRVKLRRRTKFMAISELTSDYMDTTGNLRSFEGELSTGYLVSIDSEQGQFGLGAGNNLGTTFMPPIQAEGFQTSNDYKVRFNQFINNNNDRASYSLACVIDGVCPVNFRDQLKEGHT
jgi:hypothetical protein